MGAVVGPAVRAAAVDPIVGTELGLAVGSKEERVVQGQRDGLLVVEEVYRVVLACS